MLIEVIDVLIFFECFYFVHFLKKKRADRFPKTVSPEPETKQTFRV